MPEFFRSLLGRVLEEPVRFLLKPAIKSVVAIGLLTVAAQTLYERSFDRQSLGKLAATAVKSPSKTPASKR